MVTKIVMPRFSETMRDGTVVEWLKKEGERVKKGEPIVEILGEKVTYDLEAPASGVLLKILASEDSVVPVTEAIALIGEPDEEMPEIVQKGEEEAKELDRPERVKVEKVEIRVRASPAAKRLARDHNVDLTRIEGTSPEGGVTKKDVERFIEKTRALRTVREVIPLTGIRKVTAERVSQSARTAPRVTLMMEVDASEAAKLRQKIMGETNVRVSYTVILVKAVAKALVEHPFLNSTLEKEQIKIFDDINIGVAVSTERGLVVPVVHGADKKSLTEIASALKGLIKRAREGTLIEADVTGGTFTITNLGMFDVDAFTPIINPPESSILGIGRITEKPVAVNGKIKIKPTAYLCLSFDHRIVDGAQAAQFLQRLKGILEKSAILFNFH